MANLRTTICANVDISVGDVFGELSNSDQLDFITMFFDEDLPDELQITLLRRLFNCLLDEERSSFLVNKFGEFVDEYQQDMIVDEYESMSRWGQQQTLERIVDKLDSIQKAELRKLLEG